MIDVPANAILPNSEREGLHLIWKNVRQISECMLITKVGAHMRGRPMRGIAREDENVIWFITAKTSHKDDEIAADSHACLCFADASKHTFVSMSGEIEMTDAKDQILALWNSGAEAYFPEGPGDPNIVLLKFVPEFGEYWDSPTNPVLLAIQFIKSKVIGEKPKLGENVKVSMG